MTATALETATAPNLQQLHGDHRALQAQLAESQLTINSRREELDRRIEAERERWQQENAELLADHEEVLLRATATEVELRDAVKAAYAADPTSKTIAPGLSVRVTKKPVYDKDKAFGWALKHQLALALDAKLFEKFAEMNSPDIDFVEYQESVTAVLGK